MIAAENLLNMVATEAVEDWTPRPLLPPDTRDPITKVIELLARRWGNDAPPILEARAELARLTQWTPLTPGCAMPMVGEIVNVTIDDGEENVWVESCVFREPHGFDADLEWGERVTAWRPAPAPYRGGV